MNDSITHLVEALREELKQYGEMLVLLDQQQDQVMHRQTSNLMDTVSEVNAHTEVIRAARLEREQRQRHIGRLLNLDESAGFAVIVISRDADYTQKDGGLFFGIFRQGPSRLLPIDHLGI